MLSWFEKHNKISWLITILIAAFIFYISSQPFEKGAPGPVFLLKSYLYHFIIFFFFAFFLSISLTKGNYKNKIFVFIAVFIAIAYGISDEIHQLFVSNRQSALDDALIDSVGILFAGVIYLIKLNNWRKVKKNSEDIDKA